ncbi:tRNA preQ1(34) S-adenosylmethionine ribosyltransferase-isomerase QueA [bacterium]|nr:tRNA preQ1(34) S-adenosylmethionine ribosyltransferase-isomerase QueA [candidate division CSSED10-310 bacterium]
MLVEDFKYELPDKLIAQVPAARREMSRLLVMNRTNGCVQHRCFQNLSDYLRAGDLVVLNDVKVIPARIFARRLSGARVEVFILDGFRMDSVHQALLKPARRIRPGERLVLKDGASLDILERNDKTFRVRLAGPMTWQIYLETHGCMPLPPYIKRAETDPAARLDRERYQTVFAAQPGAVAAPTAGLHFTPELLNDLRSKGVIVKVLTLWVGWGTFRPVESIRVIDHRMEEEYYSIPEDTQNEIMTARQQGRRVIAVGTTTTRALESWAADGFQGTSGERRAAALFITPGFPFRVIDGLITNFHLPGSTLIMLVSAFAGRERVLSAYTIAVAEKYRFYSYGDAMLIL